MRIVTNFTTNKASQQIEEIARKAVGQNYPHPMDAWVVGYLQCALMVHESIMKELTAEDPELTFSAQRILDAFTEILPPEVQFFTKDLEDGSV